MVATIEITRMQRTEYNSPSKKEARHDPESNTNSEFDEEQIEHVNMKENKRIGTRTKDIFFSSREQGKDGGRKGTVHRSKDRNKTKKLLQ